MQVVSSLRRREPDRDVVLVSKDLNMRIKANMLGLPAEDYFNDLVIEDTDLLEPGLLVLPDDSGTRMAKAWSHGRTVAIPSTG